MAMEPSTEKHPDTIGKFVIEDMILATNYSNLYKAFDPDLESRVAVKLYNRLKDKDPNSSSSVEEHHQRFLREARTLAHIDHPYVIAVRELSYFDGKPYYVMPYIGFDLIDEIGTNDPKEKVTKALLDGTEGKTYRLSLKRGFELLFQIAGALSAFHQRGIVHRDLKPGNILLTAKGHGSVKLCDPGHAKYPTEEEGVFSGSYMGTYNFMAPEQKRSAHNADTASDVYSWGVIAYRVLIGYLPKGIYTQPRQERKEIPKALNDLIMAALSNKIEKRPKDGFALLRAMAPLRAHILQTGDK